MAYTIQIKYRYPCYYNGYMTSMEMLLWLFRHSKTHKANRKTKIKFQLELRKRFSNMREEDIDKLYTNVKDIYFGIYGERI